MTSKYLAITGLLVMLASGSAHAEAYQRGEVFKLDVNRAALAPNPIGPPAQFEPAPAQQAETAAPGTAEAIAQPVAKPARPAKAHQMVKPRVAAAKPSVAQPRIAAAKPRMVAAAKPRFGATKKLTTTRRNPLDANASAAKVQVWPCRSGGICQWQKR